MDWQQQPLRGRWVALEVLTEAHFRPLWEVAQHPEIWRFMPFDASSYASFAKYLSRSLAQRDQGQTFPFVTIDLASGEPVGATSFLALDAHNRHVEIGATWITPQSQRTAINTEAKLLQLTDAFERLDCLRVELKTDSLNQRSQAAIKRLGATEEGTFRNHMIMPDGRIRHTVWFSITREEWPAAKRQLHKRLD